MEVHNIVHYKFERGEEGKEGLELKEESSKSKVSGSAHSPAARLPEITGRMWLFMVEQWCGGACSQ
jgi:hypothetical protein